jgi:hypothetical protein
MRWPLGADATVCFSHREGVSLEGLEKAQEQVSPWVGAILRSSIRARGALRMRRPPYARWFSHLLTARAFALLRSVRLE